MPAASASAPRIAVTRVDTTQFPLVRITLRMPSGAAKLPVHARENGRPISWQVTKGPARQAIALSVDTSNSMKGARIAAVLKAAVSFVRQQPRGVPLGVYSFSAQVHPAAAIPTPHRVAVDTLRALAPAGPDGTALYAAIVMASNDLGAVNATQRALIVVTDGQSLHDHSTLTHAIKPRRKLAYRSTRSRSSRRCSTSSRSAGSPRQRAANSVSPGRAATSIASTARSRAGSPRLAPTPT